MPFSASPPALFPTYLLPTLPFRQRRQSSLSSTSSANSSAATSPDTNPAANPTSSLSSPPPRRRRRPYLNGHASHLRCTRCLADLALTTQIISKGFTGRHGRAYLVAPPTLDAATGTTTAFDIGNSSASAQQQALLLPNLPNTFTHKPVPRQLVTGAHTVADIACALCGSVLGWKYLAAADEAQRYKVGKVILEAKRVCRSSTWETAGAAAAAAEEEEGEEEEEEEGWRMSAGDCGGWGVGLRAVEENGARALGIAAGGGQQAVEFDSQDEDECEDLFLGLWTPRLAAKRQRAKRLAKGRGES